MTEPLDEQERPLSLSLKEKIASLPTRPGVYFHKNDEGKVIYVGKAKNIRNRVRQYFDHNRQVDAKTKVLVSKIADVDVIVTDSEAEALILENNLIKQHKPRYNVLLKDDKSYPYIRVTNEEFPRVFSTRKVIRDGSKYFGPYTDLRYMYSLLRTLRSLFPLRSCDLPLTEDTIAMQKYKVCLDYHIKKCEGPCQAFVDRLHYNEHIRQSVQILNGRTREVEKQLEEQMIILAETLRFEEAAQVRNRLEVLREYSERQKVVSTDEFDRDVFALSRDDHDACTVILSVRDGKLIAKRHFYASNVLHQTDAEIIEGAMSRYYMESDFIPPEIFLPCDIINDDFMIDWLSKKRSAAVDLVVPKIGEKKKLVNMATANAEFLLRDLQLQHMKREESVPRAVASLQRDLQLSRAPRRIECFDNSHLQGTDYVSSMVVFVDGRPRKADYRKFKIKSFVGNDDFAAMREVVERRYRRLLAENGHLPDLIIIDGGKGQLSSAVEILTRLDLYGKIPIIGLAKRLEEVFVPEQSDAVILPRSSSALRLLQQLRDEAHRFAITFHRELRSKRTLQTELTAIKGLGEKSAQRLLTELGSVEAVRNTSEEGIAAIVGKSLAKRIREYFDTSTDTATSGIDNHDAQDAIVEEFSHRDLEEVHVPDDESMDESARSHENEDSQSQDISEDSLSNGQQSN